MNVRRQLLSVSSLALLCGCTSAAELDGPVVVAAPAELDPAAAGEPLVETVGPARAIDRSGGAVDSEAQAMRRQCRELKAPQGPSCEGFEDTRLECEGFAEVLETKAAKAAVRCLSARSGTPRICHYNVMEECFAAGFRTARPSSASRQACSDVLQQCAGRPRNDLSMSSCQRAINAVREDRQSDLSACMTESCGVRPCVWSLLRR